LLAVLEFHAPRIQVVAHAQGSIIKNTGWMERYERGSLILHLAPRLYDPDRDGDHAPDFLPITLILIWR
jgi:hypothetical protein